MGLRIRVFMPGVKEQAAVKATACPGDVVLHGSASIYRSVSIYIEQRAAKMKATTRSRRQWLSTRKRSVF